MNDTKNAALEPLRFPAGRFVSPADTGAAARAAWIDEIAALPALLRAAVADLDDAGLDTPYRPDGWTARQVVHHLPDSHMNAYTRFKLTLTEDTPTVKPYDEAAWATLHDSRDTPVATSLTLLDALHARWVVLLRGMSDADFERAFRHPEHGRTMTLGHTLALYAWHGRHHLAHVRAVTRPRQSGNAPRGAPVALILVAMALNGCAGYRLIRPDEVEMPSYEARAVAIPTECAGLIQRAATEGLARLTEHESRTVAFCQQQQVLRALEEEAAARRLESHAAAARFALQLATVVVGALIVILGWAL